MNKPNKPIKRDLIKPVPAVVKKKGVNSMMPGRGAEGYKKGMSRTLGVIKG